MASDKPVPSCPVCPLYLKQECLFRRGEWQKRCLKKNRIVTFPKSVVNTTWKNRTISKAIGVKNG